MGGIVVGCLEDRNNCNKDLRSCGSLKVSKPNWSGLRSARAVHRYCRTLLISAPSTSYFPPLRLTTAITVALDVALSSGTFDSSMRFPLAVQTLRRCHYPGICFPPS